MNKYIKTIENRLTDDQKDMLSRIYAPTVVGVPLDDTRRGICVLPDGEIRCYGRLYEKTNRDPGQAAYLSSLDGGLSWSRHYSQGRMHGGTYFEEPDLYITICDTGAFNNYGLGEGIWAFRSKIGPDDPNPEIIKLYDGVFNDSFLPKKSAFSNRIWFTSQKGEGDFALPCFFYSDDWGKTWNARILPAYGEFEIVYPHKGLRWCHWSGSEPTVAELSENKMMMLIRSPHDSYYVSYSYDGGDTWSTPEASTFYGTNTTPFLLRLSDGRVITFWNNTKPLSEPDHNLIMPPLPQDVLTGHSNDLFSNRDAAHVAITEDGGETYIGYRELILNPARNHVDFRYVGGPASSLDKSVHQFQAIELPYGKILVSVGQNQAARRLIIFDVKWLYETGRREDFAMGLGDLTTHAYVKSISGYFRRECMVNGHCQWNRAPSAYLMPDPDGSYLETLYICKHHDDRLFNDIGGVTWNFPASRKGKVSIEMKIVEKQARIILTDRWYNTCDPYAAELSPFYFELDAADIGSEFVTVDIEYDVDAERAYVYVDGKHVFNVRMTEPCPTGLSYLILQCITDGESKGFYVKSLEKQ